MSAGVSIATMVVRGWNSGSRISRRVWLRRSESSPGDLLRIWLLRLARRLFRHRFGAGGAWPPLPVIHQDMGGMARVRLGMIEHCHMPHRIRESARASYAAETPPGDLSRPRLYAATPAPDHAPQPHRHAGRSALRRVSFGLGLPVRCRGVIGRTVGGVRRGVLHAVGAAI